MKKTLSKLLVLTSLLVLAACNNNVSKNSSKEQIESGSKQDITLSSEEPSSTSKASSSDQKSSSISSSSEAKSSSEKDPNLREDELYLESGLSIKFKALGATIDSVKWGNKTIAKDGFVVGRCANRIAKGKCTISGKQYSLDVNNNGNHLHGGSGSGMNSWRGPFATKNWTKVEQTLSTITYTIHSADGENGYPGNMDMTVKYTLSPEGELLIEYTATSDKDTLCNPTNHLFMTLNGDTSYNNIKLWIDADNYTPLVNQLPTGEIASVTGTKFDYTTEKAFDGSKDYDDNLVLNGEGYRKVATMTGTSLGVKVDVFTDRPGLQLYKAGSGQICLESQMFPDAINQPNFTDPILKAGEQFYSKTAYAFSEVK